MRRLSPIAFIAVILFHLWLLSQTQFTAWPEMLSYPYLINHGYHFYGDIIHPFVPLLVVVLSLTYRLFGTTVEVLQIFTTIVILSIDLLFFSIARKFFTLWQALCLLLLYSILQVGFEGNGLWFDLAEVPFLLASTRYALIWFDKKALNASALTGLFLGLALLTKLSTLWVIGLVLILAVLYQKKVLPFLLSLISTVFLTSTLFYFIVDLGTPTNFLYWALIYPLFSVTKMPGYILLPSLRQAVQLLLIISPAFFFWLHSRSKKVKGSTFIILVFFVGSVLFGVHRFSLFHLQPMLPYLCIILGIGLLGLYGRARLFRFFAVSAIVSLVVSLVWSGKEIRQSWHQPVRFFEPNVQVEARQLRQALPKEPVFFYNVPSQYFVLADAMPPKPWADTFPWYLELPGLQQTIIDSLEKNSVQWVVSAPFQQGERYQLGSYQPESIDAYIDIHYQKTWTGKYGLSIWQRKRTGI